MEKLECPIEEFLYNSELPKKTILKFHQLVREAFNILTTDGYNLKYTHLSKEQERATLTKYYELIEYGIEVGKPITPKRICVVVGFDEGSYFRLIATLKKKHLDIVKKFKREVNPWIKK